MRRRVIEVDLTDERVFCIMKVPTLGLNHPSGFARIFFRPFGNNVVVGLDFEQTLEDQRKTLCRRFFEGQNPHVIVVDAEMHSVAFEMGFAEVVIEKGVVFEPRRFDLLRGKVERLLEHTEGFLLVEETDWQKIADLENEALDLLKQTGLALGNLAVEEKGLFSA